MKTTQKNVMIYGINNQIRYYSDIIRDLKAKAAEYTKPNSSGDIPTLTAIEQAEYDGIMNEINKYRELKLKEEVKLTKLK